MPMGALTSFVLGMGMTITACCIFLAVLLAPSLIEVGLDPLAVRMFIMYWGMGSFIARPLALAAFAAASITRAGPMETGLQVMNVGSSTQVVQFPFLVNPSLVLQGRLGDFARHTSTALLGVARVDCGVWGCLIAWAICAAAMPGMAAARGTGAWRSDVRCAWWRADAADTVADDGRSDRHRIARDAAGADDGVARTLSRAAARQCSFGRGESSGCSRRIAALLFRLAVVVSFWRR